jgi:putative hemolysin
MAITLHQPAMSAAKWSPGHKLVDLSDHRRIRPIWPVIGRLLEHALGLDRLNRDYARFGKRLESSGSGPANAFRLALDILGVTYTVSAADRATISTEGPLVVVANHPFGGLEGLILSDILCGVRPDVKILGNYLLEQVAGINNFIIPVDPFQHRTAIAANRQGLKTALRWLKNGGLLVTFPAGEVSRFDPRRRRVQDPPWSAHIGGIIQRTGASVLPVFFPGQNSLVFQFLGMAHPLLRTIMLPRELLNKTNQTIPVHIGKPITRHQLRRFNSDAERVAYLRAATYFLGNREPHSHPKRNTAAAHPAHATPDRRPVVGPEPRDLWENEINQLPARQRLVEKGAYAVYIAGAAQIPHLLREIGRLREITFREVNEGTGNPIDIDRFDTYYQHLFLWHVPRQELVGAYRLGLTDQILADKGPTGLYTHQLFKFKPEFIEHLRHAIEFGRSFIRSEYQKKFHSLMLLWKGIGEFVSRHPGNNILFGAVSISQDYHKVSRNLMVRFLKENRFDRQLSRFVKPRNPFHSRRIEGISRHLLRSSFQDIGDVSVLISEIEKDGKGIPVLLRQYLNLNGKFLSFNVDKMFSDVVDGLLVVDLKQSDPRLLKRFMGARGFNRFRDYHHLGPPKAPRPAIIAENPGQDDDQAA